MDVSFSINPLLAGAIIFGFVALRFVRIEMKKSRKTPKVKL